MKTYKFILIMILFSTTYIYSTPGIRFFFGATSIKNGNYYPWNSTSKAAQSNNLIAGGAILATGAFFELNLYGNYTPIKGSIDNEFQISGSSLTLGGGIAFFPFGDSDIGVGANIGSTSATLNGYDFGGITLEPEISYHFRLNSYGTVFDEEGNPHARQALSLFVCLGYRMGIISTKGAIMSTQENVPNVELDWGGPYIKVGFSFHMN